MYKLLKKIFVKEPQYGTGWLGDEKEHLDPRNFNTEEIFKSYPTPEWKEIPPSQWKKFEPIRNQAKSNACFPYNTKVLMEDYTFKPIGEIKEGERVITHTGVPRRVIKTFKRKWQGRTIKIIPYGLSDGIESTLEHPYLTKNGWKEAKDITTNDYIALLIPTIVADKTLYWFEKDPDFLWLLGLYLAEGYITETQIHFTLHEKETELIEKIEKIVKEKLRAEKVSVVKRKNSKSVNVQFNSVLWSKVFEELGGKKAEFKRLHPRLLFLEPYLQYKIFEGWRDGNGWRGKKGEVITTISQELAYQMRTILLRNGFCPTILTQKEKIDKNGVKHKKCYRLNIYPNSSSRMFRDGNYIWCKVRKIEFPQKPRKSPHKTNKYTLFSGGHVYNLEVEGDHTYIVEGFVVHNCVSFSIALALGVENYLEEQKFEILSPRFIYSRGFVPPDGGMFYLQALEIARKEGTCLEQQMPSDLKDENSMRIKDDTYNARWVAQIYKANSYVFLPLDIDVVAGTLQSTNKAILLGTRFNSGGFSKAEVVLDKNGQYGHAVVGVFSTLYKGKKAIIIQNSYGDKWGIGGLGIITEDQFKKGVVLAAYLIDFKYQPQAQNKPKFYIYATYLKVGDRGNDVVKLQTGLQWLGYFPAQQEITGYYGGITRNAVKLFQQAYNLPITGEMDLNSVKQFNNIFGS